jgi:hypothetical protein
VIEGVVGALFTVTAKLPFVVPQLLLTATDTEPEAALALHVVVIEFVPCPPVIVTFEGTVHTYDIPDCAVMLYVTPAAPAHNVAVPVTVGVVGAVETVTAVDDVSVPQAFPICNDTTPETALAVQVVVILFVPAPTVIFTPDGTVHV